MTHLKLQGDIVDVAAIFIVVACVLPNQAHRLVEGIPALEESVSGRLVASHYSLNLLLNGGQRHGFLDELVVVLDTS